MEGEFQHKITRVRAVLEKVHKQGALLARQSNFSWLACGGEARVAINTERASAAWLVTANAVYLLANHIEMPRVLHECVSGCDFQAVEFPWHDPAAPKKAVADLCEPRQILSDDAVWGFSARPEAFTRLRFSLHPEEFKRFSQLGKAVEAAMTQTCRRIEPGETEYQIAAELCAASLTLGLTPVVLLVATDERVRKFRHPLPSRKRLRRHAVLSIGARQHGLIAAITRSVYFGGVPGRLEKIHRAVCAVDAALQENTRIGSSVGTIFGEAVDEYRRQGFPEEWQRHHQGGACGYETRDYLASRESREKVAPFQPFAWNPSITGTKSEDTIVATPRGIVVVTQSADWPMVEIQRNDKRVLRPAILAC